MDPTECICLNMQFSILHLISTIEDDEEIKLAKDALDWQNDDDDRALMVEAMKDAKAIDEAFLITGTILEVEHGISA